MGARLKTSAASEDRWAPEVFVHPDCDGGSHWMSVLRLRTRSNSQLPMFRCDPFARDVAFDPGRCGWRTYSNRLAGGDEQLIGHGEAKRLGGLEIRTRSNGGEVLRWRVAVGDH
jgi:hypothetical protein